MYTVYTTLVQRETAFEAWERVSRAPLFIDDSLTDVLRELCQSLWKLARHGTVAFVVVDFLFEDRPSGLLARSTCAGEVLAGVA